MSIEGELLGAFEEHSPDGIRELLAAGASPTEPIDGTRPIDFLIGMYLRSPRFDECLQILLDAGARRATGPRFYRREAGGLARIRSPRASTNIRTAA